MECTLHLALELATIYYRHFICSASAYRWRVQTCVCTFYSFDWAFSHYIYHDNDNLVSALGMRFQYFRAANLIKCWDFWWWRHEWTSLIGNLFTADVQIIRAPFKDDHNRSCTRESIRMSEIFINSIHLSSIRYLNEHTFSCAIYQSSGRSKIEIARPCAMYAVHFPQMLRQSFRCSSNEFQTQPIDFGMQMTNDPTVSILLLFTRIIEAFKNDPLNSPNILFLLSLACCFQISINT